MQGDCGARFPTKCIRELSAPGTRPSGRLGASKPRNLEYSAKAGERATSKRRERRAPLTTTWGRALPHGASGYHDRMAGADVLPLFPTGGEGWGEEGTCIY